MNKLISVITVVSLLLSLVSCTSEKEKLQKQNDLKTDNAAATTEKAEYNTFTGLKPLEKVNFSFSEKDTQGNWSRSKIEHSYGVAKEGKAHNISVESQKFFEEKGFSAVTLDSKSTNNIYLTFDCGYENGYTAKILDTLKEKNVKAAFFCTLDQIKSEPQLIARMINEGHIVGNHSTTHPSFDTLTKEEIAKELEECENYLREKFGYSSSYFRFPQGNYSEYALDTVSSLGFVSVFWSLAYADWNTEKRNGADYTLEKVTSRLHPGAVILLHSVSPDNGEALGRIIDFAREKGYEFSSIDKINLNYSNYNTNG